MLQIAPIQIYPKYWFEVLGTWDFILKNIESLNYREVDKCKYKP